MLDRFLTFRKSRGLLVHVYITFRDCFELAHTL